MDTSDHFTNALIDTQVTDTSVVLHDLFLLKYYWRVRAKNASGWGPYSDVWYFTTFLDNLVAESGVPQAFELQQNFPNPFNPVTTIRYGIPFRSHVKLEIYNALGQKVKTLVDGIQDARYYHIRWQAHLPSGIYFYRLEAVSVKDASKRFVQVKKMILMK